MSTYLFIHLLALSTALLGLALIIHTRKTNKRLEALEDHADNCTDQLTTHQEIIGRIGRRPSFHERKVDK